MPSPPVPAAEAARQRARRKRLRRRLMAVVYGISLLLLAIALYLAYGPKPPPPPIVLPVSHQQAAAATSRIDAVRQALIQPPTAPAQASSAPNIAHASSGPHARVPSFPAHLVPPPPVEVTRRPNGGDMVTLRVSQSDVNAYLASDPKSIALLRAHGVHAVSVNFDPPNQITIHAAATFHGMSGNGIVTASLVPDPKTGMRLNIQDARFGRLPPSALTSAANTIVARVLQTHHAPLGLTIRSAQIVGTELVITGVRPQAK